jgi:hypothetical protein
MNYSFKARNCFSGHFFKTMYKNKSMFNMFSSTTNTRKSFVYMQNKFFITSVLSMLNSTSLIGKSSFPQLVTGQLKSFSELEKEQTGYASLCTGDGMVLLNELFLTKNGNIHSNNIERQSLEQLDTVGCSVTNANHK